MLKGRLPLEWLHVRIFGESQLWLLNIDYVHQSDVELTVLSDLQILTAMAWPTTWLLMRSQALLSSGGTGEDKTMAVGA